MQRLACIALVGGITAGCHHESSSPPSPVAALDAGVTLSTTSWGHCGPLECRQYDSVADAFEGAMASRPRVVAVGEAHAQRGTTVRSSAYHFTNEILPRLVGRASDLLVEAMKPPTGCGKTTEVVRGQQAVVTEKQAPTDQGEYVTMGTRARELGIIPDLLRPSCEDLAAVEASGEDAVPTSLAMIARLTRVQVDKLLTRDEQSPGDAEKIVVTYGGALHNDPAPKPERAAWSFAPALLERTKGRYVAIDLYVPELIDGSDAWKRLAFYPYYDIARDGARTTAFRDGKSFVIVLPRTAEK